jgi:hypothetical protein
VRARADEAHYSHSAQRWSVARQRAATLHIDLPAVQGVVGARGGFAVTRDDVGTVSRTRGCPTKRRLFAARVVTHREPR